MIYSIIQPPDELKDLVCLFWVSEFTGIDDVFTYYSTAETFSKLVFLYKKGGESCSREFMYAAFQGQSQTFDQIPTKGSFEIFGVHLFPHAIPRLFKIPSPEVNDQLLDLPALFGVEGIILNEKMAEATNTQERISIISKFFKCCLSSNTWVEPAIIDAMKQIRLSKGNVHIPTLADYYCLSQKQFERKFREWSGFHPKLFSRIVRFESAVNNYGQFKSLTELAYSSGYYDQSHFIRDFKQFTGFSPKHFFSLVHY